MVKMSLLCEKQNIFKNVHKPKSIYTWEKYINPKVFSHCITLHQR